jgi:hypothetical protein
MTQEPLYKRRFVMIDAARSLDYPYAQCRDFRTNFCNERITRGYRDCGTKPAHPAVSSVNGDSQ